MDLQWISLLMFAVMTAVLVSASISDWRTREVSDVHWAVLGSVGIIGFTAICMLKDSARWEYFIMACVSFMILIDIVVDTDRFMLPFYIVLGVLCLVSLYYMRDSMFFAAWLSVPVSYIIYIGTYVFGLIQGGADVKCLICLALMFPIYPMLWELPLIPVKHGMLGNMFTFSISTLFFGTAIVMILGIRFLMINRRAGDKGEGMFTGYMMPLEKARISHVWPMQDVVDGQIVRGGAQEEDLGAVYDRLEAAGAERVWITPMIPFVIPITAAAIFLALIGNPLFLI